MYDLLKWKKRQILVFGVVASLSKRKHSQFIQTYKSAGFDHLLWIARFETFAWTKELTWECHCDVSGQYNSSSQFWTDDIFCDKVFVNLVSLLKGLVSLLFCRDMGFHDLNMGVSRKIRKSPVIRYWFPIQNDIFNWRNRFDGIKYFSVMANFRVAHSPLVTNHCLIIITLHEKSQSPINCLLPVCTGHSTEGCVHSRLVFKILCV